jgi:hypothetical protein
MCQCVWEKKENKGRKTELKQRSRCVFRVAMSLGARSLSHFHLLAYISSVLFILFCNESLWFLKCKDLLECTTPRVSPNISHKLDDNAINADVTILTMPQIKVRSWWWGQLWVWRGSGEIRSTVVCKCLPKHMCWRNSIPTGQCKT